MKNLNSVANRLIIYVTKTFKWRSLGYLLIFCCLAGVTVYPDEQAYWIQLFRGSRDGWLINNFMPMCESFWSTEVPLSWRPARIFLYFLNGVIEKPIFFRALGLTYFLSLIYLFRLLEKKLIINNAGGNLAYFNILFYGLIPVSLVYIRPESMMLLCLISAILLFESNINSLKLSKTKLLAILILFTIEVNLHGRAIFMAPIFLFITASLGYQKKSKVVISIVFFMLGWIIWETLITYRALYECGSNSDVKEIINSLRFNPEIIRGGIKVFLTEIMNRHLEVYNILKGAVFINPEGAFPLSHKKIINYGITQDIFGFIKTTLIAIFIFVLFGFAYLGVRFKLIKGQYKLRFFLISTLMIFLYLDVILMKTDRFYEASIFWPTIILILMYQVNIFGSIKITWHSILSNYFRNAILICFYLISTFFILVYGGELLLKGGVTYVSIWKHDSSLYKNAVHRAAEKVGIDIQKSSLIVGDFHTIHYTAAGKFPVMANLFWWFSDKSTSNYADDYGKLKLLNDLNSDGLIVRCDSLPEKIRSLADVTLIEESRDATLQNTLCTISGSMLKTINFDEKLLKP